MLQAMREGVGRWIVIVILAFIAFSFIFFGIDFTSTTTTFAARVNGETIDLAEFDRVLQAQQNQYQQLYRIELTDDLRREIRANVIENLVRGRVLEQRVKEAGYRASDVRVAAAIQADENFRVGDQFRADVYRNRLATAGIVPAQYEEEERTRLALEDLQNGIINSTFLTPAEFRSYIALERQRRRLGYALFGVDAFSSGIEIADADIETAYADNGSRYTTDESVDLEFVEVSQPDIAANLSVTEEDLQAYYDEERDSFETVEERSVRHILITDSDEAAANAKAEDILARLNAGESFEDLAREFSDERPGGVPVKQYWRSILIDEVAPVCADLERRDRRCDGCACPAEKAECEGDASQIAHGGPLADKRTGGWWLVPHLRGRFRDFRRPM